MEIDPKLPETIHEVGQLIPDTLHAFDEVAAGMITTVGFPFLYAKEKVDFSIAKTKEELKTRLDQIPKSQLRQPPTYMVASIMPNLVVYADYEYLRKMFINLLASSMDSEKETTAHPSFNEIIKNLSPLDAKILTSEIFQNDSFPVYDFRYQKDTIARIVVKGCPLDFFSPTTGVPLIKNFINVLDQLPIEEISQIDASIENLRYLGVIEVEDDRHWTSSQLYERDISAVETIKEKLEEIVRTKGSKVDGVSNPVVAVRPKCGRITIRGRNFLNTCL